MAAELSRELEPFLRVPWTRALLQRPNVVVRVPNPRKIKVDGEDSAWAETLKTPRTFAACVSFYEKPSRGQERIEQVSTLVQIGDGLNGHPDIMHGGIVGVLLDEACGILQSIDRERRHLMSVACGKSQGELPDMSSSFTAQLNITYKAPVYTPGPLIIHARYTKIEGRKEWIYVEMKQRVGASEDYDGDEVLCAYAEALFIHKRPTKL